MTQLFTDNYVKVCMKAWLLCEAFVHTETLRDNPREFLLSRFSECGQSCFSLVSNLTGDYENAEESSLQCLIHCREITKLCMDYSNDKDLQACDRACSGCIEMILKEFTLERLN